jgi:hypothetical protein
VKIKIKNMKSKILLLALLFNLAISAQEHYTGLTTSSRGGIISGGINPAEFANLNSKIEVNLYGLSINASNNKIGFEDIISGKNLEKILFAKDEPVNARLDAEAYLPSFAINIGKWGFGLSPKINAKLNVIDVDANLGDALFNNAITSNTSATINYPTNQRVVGTVWGEVGLSVARSLVDNENNKLSIGGTFKLMFPGSYSNIGLSAFKGTFSQPNSLSNNVYLNNAQAELNIAYSGNLANNFTEYKDYSKSIFGDLNGFTGDIGISYQRKDKSALDVLKSKNKYKLNIGVSVRNIGSMTFKDDNNYNTNYKLEINDTTAPAPPVYPGFNLTELQNVDNLQQIEDILKTKGYLVNSQNKNDFTVKLPTTLVAYADIKLISKLYISGYMQQKFTDDSENDQITAQNYITITPRINLGFFETYIPLSNSEISGFNAGFGFRLGGFYLGSGSAITSFLDQKNSKQADFYTGVRIGI